MVIIGYIGTFFVVFSFLLASKIKLFRIVNTSGQFLVMAEALHVGSSKYNIVIITASVALINIYYLFKGWLDARKVN